MPSPGVQSREPLHNFKPLIGYDFIHIDDIITTRYVAAVDIGVTNWDRGRK